MTDSPRKLPDPVPDRQPKEAEDHVLESLGVALEEETAARGDRVEDAGEGSPGDESDPSGHARAAGEAGLGSGVRAWFLRLAQPLIGRRWSLKVQISAGLGVAVGFSVAASVAALITFFQVGTLQRQINTEHVPALTNAVQIGQLAANLAGSAPRVVAAARNRRITEEVGAEVEGLSQTSEVDLLENAARIIELSSGLDATERTQGLQEFSSSLAGNLRAIQVSVDTAVVLADRLDAVQARAVELLVQLNEQVGPPLDDQIFYMATGLRELDDEPAPVAVRASVAEVMRHEALSSIWSRGNIAVSLLTDVATQDDLELLETIEERFRAATGGAAQSLTALGDRAPAGLQETLATIEDVGLGEDGAFATARQHLEELRNQLTYLTRNEEITGSLEQAVATLTVGLEVEALEATEASETALSLGRMVLVIFNVVGLGIAVLIMWLFVARHIIPRLTGLSRAMRNMAEGDLETEITVHGRDEVGEMAQALEVFRRHALEVQRLNLVEQLLTKVERQKGELETTLVDLRRAQDQMVMQEKLASLGQLTAGIAHEIKNPLNFVNNFADVSTSLLEDLQEEINDIKDAIPEDSREEIEDIGTDLTGNLKRIVHHGKRASSIVYGMLEHARKEGGEKRPTAINPMLEEFIALAFHSMRATDNTFQMTIHKDFGEDVGDVEAVPQDLSRVFLNIVTNACQATLERQQAPDVPPGYQPTLDVRSRRENGRVEVRIRDNGPGIPAAALRKIFEPFFTTKDANKGTGLGLSLAHDIVRGHGGELVVESKEGEGAEFIVTLPA